MPAEPERLAAQLLLLSSTNAAERIDAAEQLAGWWRHLDRDQSSSAARSLAEAVAAEADKAAREAELHALVELDNASLFDRDDLVALSSCSRRILNVDDHEYVEILEDRRVSPRQRCSSSPTSAPPL
jgi:hypothetical protein